MTKQFSVNIPQTIVNDLQFRLKNTRWPDEIENASWLIDQLLLRLVAKFYKFPAITGGIDIGQGRRSNAQIHTTPEYQPL